MASNKRIFDIGLLIGLAILSILAGFLIGRVIDSGSKTAQEPVAKERQRQSQSTTSKGRQSSSGSGISSTSSPGRSTTSEAENRSVSNMPVLSEVGTPVYDAKSETYQFSAKARVESGDNLIYQLIDKKNQVVASNFSGSFSGVKPSEDGVYYLQVVNSLDKEFKTNPHKVSGFDVQQKVPQQPLVAKITKSDLADRLNTGDYSSSFSKNWVREHMAPSYTISCSGLKNGERAPKTIGDICNGIQMGTWSSVTVSSLSFNEMNQVNHIGITVNYSEE